jgi:hypothetical protein
VEFAYSDISGKRHTQRLYVDIEIFAFGKEDHEGNYAVGSFSFGTRRLMREIIAKRQLEKQALLSAVPLNLQDDSSKTL